MASNDLDIQRALTAYVEWLDRPDTVGEPIALAAADTDRFRARRRSRSLVLVAAALVLAIGAAAVLARQGDGRVRDRSTPSATEPGVTEPGVTEPNPTVTTGGDSSGVVPSTAQNPRPDLAPYAAITSQGDALFVTGGEVSADAIASTRRRFVDGRPDQVLADAPHARAGGIALATEREIVVAAGDSSSVDVYVLAEDRWRTAPVPPVDISTAEGAPNWEYRYKAVVAAASDRRLAILSRDKRSIAVLTLDSGEWNVYAVPEQIDLVGALHWLTPRLLAIVPVWGAEQSVYRVAVLDVETSRVRFAPDRSMRSGNLAGEAHWSTTVATNGSLLVWADGASSTTPGFPNGPSVAFTLDPATMVWRPAAAPDMHACDGSTRVVRSPSRVFAFNGCSPEVAMLDVASGRWSALPEATRRVQDAIGLPRGYAWVDGRLVFWSPEGRTFVIADPALEE